MKKLFLLGILSLMIYSCQKQTIEPFNGPQNNIIQSQCGILGDCYSGTYLFDSTRTADAPGLDTVITGLTVQVLYNGDTVMNGNTYIKYKLDSATCSLPYIAPNILHTYNTFTWLKGTTYGDGVVLSTRTSKTLIFWKI